MACLIQFDLWKASKRSFLKVQRLPMESILALPSLENARIFCASNVRRTLRFKTKHCALNCARDWMWIFCASIHSRWFRVSRPKRSCTESVLSIPPFIAPETHLSRKTERQLLHANHMPSCSHWYAGANCSSALPFGHNGKISVNEFQALSHACESEAGSFFRVLGIKPNAGIVHG